MEQFREVIWSSSSSSTKSDVEKPEEEFAVNPAEVTEKLLIRLQTISEQTKRNHKYVKKSGHKPELRNLKFKHWKPVLKLVARMEVIKEMIQHPSYRSVRKVALNMLREMNQVKMKRRYVTKAQKLLHMRVQGFPQLTGIHENYAAENEACIKRRIEEAMRKKRKTEAMKLKLTEHGIDVNDSLDRVLSVRENYLLLKKQVLDQAKEKYKILKKKHEYLDSVARREFYVKNNMISWRKTLETEWDYLGKQTSKILAGKEVKKRLQDMAAKKKSMKEQLASLPASVRRNIIFGELSKMYRDLKRLIEDIRDKKPDIETVMMRKLEKRKRKKMLILAKKKRLKKEEQTRLRAIKEKRKKRKMVKSVTKIKEIKEALTDNYLGKKGSTVPQDKSLGLYLRPSAHLGAKKSRVQGSTISTVHKEESAIDMLKGSLFKRVASAEEVSVALKDELLDLRPDSNARFELSISISDIPESGMMYFDVEDNTWKQKSSFIPRVTASESYRVLTPEELQLQQQFNEDRVRRSALSRSQYHQLLEVFQEEREREAFTKRLEEKVEALQIALNSTELTAEISKAMQDSIANLSAILQSRRKLTVRLEEENAIYEENQERQRLRKEWRKLKRKEKKEFQQLLYEGCYFDFPEDRRPLWTITGDGWSWTGYKVYTLDDRNHPWGFTEGLQERTPLQLCTKKYPAPDQSSGYKCLSEFTDQLKAHYINEFLKKECSRGVTSGSITSTQKSVTVSSSIKSVEGMDISTVFKALSEGISVPHIAGRIAAPTPIPTMIEQDNNDGQDGPPAFSLREELPEPIPYYGHNCRYVIKLVETETIELFQLDTNIIYADSEEADSFLDYQEKAKENKRRREAFEVSNSDVSTQVVLKAMGTVGALAPAPIRKSFGIQVCTGDIQISHLERTQSEIDPNILYLNAKATSSSDGEEDESSTAIVCSKRFMETANVVERILSTNPFINSLIAYKGGLVPDPLASQVDIHYELVYLWTYHYPKNVDIKRLKRQSVTTISWSDKVESILSVGYGSFFSGTFHYGLIAVWNLKNLNYPERIIRHRAGACHVEFSQKHPYILSCSFQDGFIAVYNIYPNDPVVICDNGKTIVNGGEPIWQVSWLVNSMGEEVLVSGGQNGEFFAYQTQNFKPAPIMAITRKEGKVFGYANEKTNPNQTRLQKIPAVTTFVRIPNDKENFLVGTEDGSVRVISLFARNLQTDLFNAHRGRVNRIEFNPFCSKLFLTVGGDFALRVWAMGMNTPLLSLIARDGYTEDAAWSSTNPSLLVSISEIYVDLWDLGRCSLGKPVATIANPNQRRNSCIRFSLNGRNVAVGDIWGDVHMFCLGKMPFDPLLTQEALLKSLSSALAFTPHILHKLMKLGPPFDVMTAHTKKKSEMSSDGGRHGKRSFRVH